MRALASWLKGRRKGWLLLVPILVVAVWNAWQAATYASTLRLYVVPSTSMAPTILPSDRICVETAAGVPSRRGELWVFTLPSGGAAVKRVIGLPGERVDVAGGRIRIDGRPLEEPYLARPTPYAMPPVALGRGQYFLLGDNRATSFDSHVWGPLDGRAFLGRVVDRVWPANRLGGLR